MENEWTIQNKKFLELADQFSIQSPVNEILTAEERRDLGGLLADISKLQEEICTLKLFQNRDQEKAKFGLVVQRDTLVGLHSKIEQLSSGLEKLVSISGAVQHKLTNLVLGNSLPLLLHQQEDFIQGIGNLVHITSRADALLAAAEWVSNQDWSTATGELSSSCQLLEASVARLRSALFRLQTFRQQISQASH